MAPEAEDRVDTAEARAGARRAPFDDSPRGRVLAATVEVIAHDGYREATVDRVLDRARVGWRDFAGLFGDLDSCLLATVEAGMECAADRAEEAAAGAAGVEATFESALRAVLEAAAAYPDLARLCLVEAATLGERAMERREAWLERFVELLERGLSASDAPAGMAPPGLAAEMVVGGIHEILQRKVRAGEVEDIPALADELRQLWLPPLRGA